MKEKIFQALKQAYASKFGVADDVLQGLAGALDATGLVTDENLATVIQGQESALRAYQSNADRWNTERSNLSKQIDELKKKKAEVKTDDGKNSQSQNPPKENDKGSLTAEDVAKILEGHEKPLKEQLETLTKAKATAERQASVAAAAKKYGISEDIAQKFAVPENTDVEEFFKTVKQDFVNAGLQSAVPPEKGGGKASTEEDDFAKAISKDTAEIVKNQTIKK